MVSPRTSLRFLPLFFLILSCLCVTTIRAEELLTGQEAEIERISLGHRGVLIFANELRDVIEGESVARIYLMRHRGPAKVLDEREGMAIDEVYHRDVNGDGVKEVCVVWSWMGQGGLRSVELYAVAMGGSLQRLFPSSAASPLHNAEILFCGEDKDVPPAASFAVRYGLCDLFHTPPILRKTVSYHFDSGEFHVVSESVEEPETLEQELNIAAEWYQMGQYENGLKIARQALDKVRIRGAENLLATAYRMVANGYRGMGSEALAQSFDRRAVMREKQDNVCFARRSEEEQR